MAGFKIGLLPTLESQSDLRLGTATGIDRASIPIKVLRTNLGHIEGDDQLLRNRNFEL